MPAEPTRSSWHSLAFLAFVVLMADQASKFAVQKFTQAGSQRVIVPGLINFVHTSNPGIAFGLFADSQKPWVARLLILFSIAVIVLLFWLLASGRAGGRLAQLGLTLILGGAAGNVVDRVVRQSVTDFIDFHIRNYHWYTFNVADSAIVVGAGLVVLELFLDWRHPTQERVS
jgi:signal peptidase II